MKILHTSDWHIGRTLYSKKRYEEFESFLAWLADTIQQNEIDALLVAGDVFDTIAPSNRAQELYYRFLYRIASSSPCQHVVVVAGNHDSPSFLNAPRELLKVLNVHVVGCSTEKPEDEVLVLHNKDKKPEMIVCAVPYLRDRDIRVSEAGESFEDKEQKLIDGIRKHYKEVASSAEQKRRELEADIPIVAMGHLFTAGGQILENDGVRELYVGTLAHVNADIFPACFSYVALGHLHIPQEVGNSEKIRYSGSPLPMGFGEATQQKSVCQVEFHSAPATVKLIDVPQFQMLRRIEGDWDNILTQIENLSRANSQCWLEVIYMGEEIIGDLRERLERVISNSQMEILRIKNNRVIDQVLRQIHEEETLEDLDVDDVFKRCLTSHDVPEDQRDELLQAYKEIVLALKENDVQAE